MGKDEYEVFATGHASYDATAGALTVTLDSYLHPVDITHLEEKIVPPWLPPKQVDREHVDSTEASDLARDVFHRWCDKVHRCIPQPLTA
ncbi:MAG: hypothetical protein ABIP20_06185 [Chthoniobacteraceae bacterium]